MTRRPVPVGRATALVVGVGGIGTPCAWALADAGVHRLVLVDPDVVEPSNLPRQILFRLEDVGRAKAVVAAERLARPGLELEPVVGRFDATTAAALLEGVDVVVDGTDGAATKDLVHRCCVRAGVPFVHAAALGSEGRVLDVPSSGRPCLACLFGSGTAGEEGDTCARHGVFPGVTGAVGALAATAALGLLARPDGPSLGLRVLDLGAGRAVTLEAPADPRCPVCGPLGAGDARPEDEGLVPAPPCAAPACAAAGALDLREESCPMNLLRARRAVDRLAPGESLEVLLGAEGAATVPDGLVSLGHRVLSSVPDGPGLRLRVRRGPGPAGAAPHDTDAWLRRYARQIVMPEVGEAGQRRLGGACVRLAGDGEALVACALLLACAGVGRLELSCARPLEAAEALRWPFDPADAGRPRDEALARALARHVGVDVRAVPGPAVPDEVLRVEVEEPRGGCDVPVGGLPLPVARAQGALAADAAMRAILRLGTTLGSVRARADGTVGAAP